MKQVVIEIRNGYVYLLEKPDNIELIVKDYDVDGMSDDNLKKDKK